MTMPWTWSILELYLYLLEVLTQRNECIVREVGWVKKKCFRRLFRVLLSYLHEDKGFYRKAVHRPANENCIVSYQIENEYNRIKREVVKKRKGRPPPF